MSIYKTGNTRVKVGSSEVVGNSSVDFVTNVDSGDLFKLKSKAAFFEVSSIESATNLQLTARYSDSDYNINATGEALGTANNVATVYSGTLDHNPVLLNNLVITVSDIRFVDNGGGSLSGTNAEGTHSGSIDYDTGVWDIDLTATLSVGASYVITGSYVYGDTLNSMSYQIVTDFTPNYDFPELSLNDSNFQHVYTKAVRMIDSELRELGASSITVNSLTATTLDVSQDITIAATPYGYVLQSDDGSSWRITITNTGTVVTATF